MDKFVLITKGVKDCNNKSIIRLTPSCYEKVFNLKLKTGLSMRAILEQCVDFALDHLDNGVYGEDED